MPIETTFAVIKPDAVKRGLEDTILDIAIDAGLEPVTVVRGVALTVAAVEGLYGEHVGKDWFPLQRDYMLSGPVVLAALRGEGAVSVWRKLMGATDRTKAEDGTIRKLYALSHRENCVHGSETDLSAERELALFFGPRFVLQSLVIAWPKAAAEAPQCAITRQWFTKKLAYACDALPSEPRYGDLVEAAFSR